MHMITSTGSRLLRNIHPKLFRDIHGNLGASSKFPLMISSIWNQQSSLSTENSSSYKVWTDEVKGECVFQLTKPLHARIWQVAHTMLTPHNFSWDSQEKKWTAPSTVSGEKAAHETFLRLEKLSSKEQALKPTDIEDAENKKWADAEESNSLSYHPKGMELLVEELNKVPVEKGGISSDQTPGFDSKQKIQELLSNLSKSIDHLLPKHLKRERFIQVIEESLEKCENLFELDSSSIHRAVLIAAMLGLEPGPAAQHCYFIPIRGELRFIMGYRGLMDLTLRTENVLFFTAKCVYKEDRFNVLPGTDGKIEHVPHHNILERGDLTWIYAICTLKTGEQKEFVIPYSDLTKNKKISSRMENPKSPWFLWKEEMCLKTTIKRFLQTLELNTERHN